MQLANGQPTLLPMIATNGYHPHSHHLAAPQHHSAQTHHLNHHHPHQHNFNMQQAFLDHTGLLHQVSNAAAVAAAANGSPGAVAATANGLLAPQQRTDRLPVSLKNNT